MAGTCRDAAVEPDQRLDPGRDGYRRRALPQREDSRCPLLVCTECVEGVCVCSSVCVCVCVCACPHVCVCAARTRVHCFACWYVTGPLRDGRPFRSSLNSSLFPLNTIRSYLLAGETVRAPHPQHRLVLLGSDHRRGLRAAATPRAIQVRLFAFNYCVWSICGLHFVVGQSSLST